MRTKMAAPSVLQKICETPGCGTEAKLQCPTCIKLGISGSFFCSQASLAVFHFVNLSIGELYVRNDNNNNNRTTKLQQHRQSPLTLVRDFA